LNPVYFALGGLAVGFGLSVWTERINRAERLAMNWPLVSTRGRWWRCALLMLVTAILFAGFDAAVHEFRVLETAEVQPSGVGRQLRMAYHLILISLLVAATATDFDCYIIPDQISVPGILIGVIGAVAVGELQLCHLWVDWHFAIPHLRGPRIPGWYDVHRSWHGLAWSLSGLVTGATITWIARQISSRVLGQEAMGLGDVTLMAMIGSFLGWQGAVLVFLLAPLAGLTVGITIMLVSGKTYLPYGPWLGLAAVFVLFRWGWLWENTRLVFSDWLGMGILGAAGVGGFILLLGLVRLYRAIPVRRKS
jgi:leader peptidase (prepilin peptidase)/N-methyltransferase